jgi:hypothetical protein
MEGYHQGEQNDQKIHQPEFVILGEESKEEVSGGEFQQQTSHPYESFEKLHDIKPSLGVRFACLLSSYILFLAAILVFFLLLLSLAVVIISVGQSKKVNNLFKKYWEVLRKLIVTASGLLVSVFSPAFGLGIIILYFIIVAGGTNDPIFSRLFESGLYKPTGSKS